MNKEQTLAARRIESSIKRAKANESLAKRNTLKAEAKTKKALECMEVAKDIVAKQKATLEIAKQQILEQRELINRYESLLNLKYKQVDEGKQAVKSAVEAANKNAKIAKALFSKAEELKVAQERIEKQSGVLKLAKEHIIKIREEKEELKAELDKAIAAQDDAQEVPPVEAEPAPIEDQAPATADAEEPKVEEPAPAELPAEAQPAEPAEIPEAPIEEIKDPDRFDESKATRIAEIYKSKYGIETSESMQIFSKFGMREAVERIQTLANLKASKKVESKKVAPKRVTKKNEANVKVQRPAKAKPSNMLSEDKAKRVAKVYFDKYKIDEASSLKILRTYDQETALNKLQSIANVTKKFNESKAVKPAPAKKANEAQAPAAPQTGVSLYSLFI